MNTLETDAEVNADGSLKLLSPLPAWLKPGMIHRLLVVAGSSMPQMPKRRQIPTATPEMIAQRQAAFEKLREINPYHEITDSVAWQREVREDVVLPGRE
jgi:hypothetical protein